MVILSTKYNITVDFNHHKKKYTIFTLSNKKNAVSLPIVRLVTYACVLLCEVWVIKPIINHIFSYKKYNIIKNYIQNNINNINIIKNFIIHTSYHHISSPNFFGFQPFFFINKPIPIITAIATNNTIISII